MAKVVPPPLVPSAIVGTRAACAVAAAAPTVPLAVGAAVVAPERVLVDCTRSVGIAGALLASLASSRMKNHQPPTAAATAMARTAAPLIAIRPRFISYLLLDVCGDAVTFATAPTRT